MKVKRVQMLGVSAFVAGSTILLGTWGCTTEPKPAAENDKQMMAAPAPAQPASAMQDSQMRAPVEAPAPEKAPMVQPMESAKTEAPPMTGTHGAPTVYVVRKGDTLAGISQKCYGTEANWKMILDANLNLIKAPKDLRPNMKLVIPPAKTSSSASSAGRMSAP